MDNIICGKNSYALSDRRIKTNIKDINDESSLHKILEIEPKIYGYIDNIKRTNSNVYGFIAQQIREVLPEATELTIKYIPDIFKLAKINKSFINLNEDDLRKIKIDEELEIYTKDKSYEVRIIEKTNEGIRIDKEINEIDIFIYGRKVKDFHIIDKSYLYTLNICATQELARII
jgi:6-pyruvoyl-tetrahydropterin synthase